MPWATPNDAVADLRDFLDASHGAGQWSFRSTPHTGTDCLPALHDALAALRARYGYGVVRVVGGGGMFRFGGVVSPSVLNGMMIEGVHPNDARMVFDTNAGALFQWTGAGGFTGGGMKRTKVYLEEGYPNSLCYPLLLQGDATYQPDDMTFEDNYFSALGGSSFYAGPMINGAARTAPQGIRVLNIRNMQVFNCRMFGGYFANLVQSTVDNFGVYVGAAEDGYDTYITGGTVASDFRRINVAGDLIVRNVHNVFLSGGAARVWPDATAQYCSGFLEGRLIGAFGKGSDVRFLV